MKERASLGYFKIWKEEEEVQCSSLGRNCHEKAAQKTGHN